MIRIKEIAFTGYPVTDVARARRFYEGVLQLKPSVEFKHDDKYWIEYDVGPSTLAISNMSTDKWKSSADGPCCTLEVEDFDAAINSLRDQNVKFAMEPMDSGVCRMAYIHDPDGNSLGIHKRRPNGG